MIRSTPLKRDASSEINFKGISNTVNDTVPLHKTDIWGYQSDPKVKNIPNVLCQLSYLEVLLNKRVIVESNVDFTDAVSVDTMNNSLSTLKDLTNQQEEIIKSSLKISFADCTISYFLFQYNLANLFPMCASHFNSPVDPFGSEIDHHHCLGHLVTLNSVLIMIKKVQGSIGTLLNEEIEVELGIIGNILQNLDDSYAHFYGGLVGASQSQDTERDFGQDQFSRY